MGHDLTRAGGPCHLIKLENGIGQTVIRAEPGKWYVFACLTILGLALTSNIESSAERAIATDGVLSPVDFQVFYIGGKVVLQKGATPLYCPPADQNQGHELLYKYADASTPWAQLARANGFPKSCNSPILLFPQCLWRLWR